METKEGRPRRLEFETDLPGATPEAAWMLGMLLELGERLFDQIEHLPPQVLNALPEKSYLSPARVALHALGTDYRFLQMLIPNLEPPPYAASLAATKSENLLDMNTAEVDTLGLFRAHLAFRRVAVLNHCRGPEFLDSPVDHPSFTTKRGLLGHLLWHWSFHSGHVGAVTLELGYEYNWRST